MARVRREPFDGGDLFFKSGEFHRDDNPGRSRKLQEEEERRLKKENSWFNKFKKGLTKFGKDIVSEE